MFLPRCRNHHTPARTMRSDATRIGLAMLDLYAAMGEFATSDTG